MGISNILKKPKREKTPSSNFKKLKLLVTIVNRNKTEFYLDLLSGFEINFQTSVLGQGTAHSETLRLLGLEDLDRGVLFSIIREDNAESALQALEDKFQTVRGGKGIAFTIPLSGVVGVAIYQFLSNNKTGIKEGNKWQA